MDYHFLVGQIAGFRAFLSYFQAGVRRLISGTYGLTVDRIRVEATMDVRGGVGQADRASDVACLCGRFIYRAYYGRVLDSVADYVDYTAIRLAEIFSKRDTAAIDAFATMNVGSGLASNRANVSIEAASSGLSNQIGVVSGLIVRRDRRFVIVGEDGRTERRGFGRVAAGSERRFFIDFRLDNFQIVLQLGGVVVLYESGGYVGTGEDSIVIVFGDRLALNIKARMDRCLTFTASINRRLRGAIYRVGEGQRMIFHFIHYVARRRALITYALFRQVLAFCAAISVKALLIGDKGCATEIAFRRMLSFNVASFLGRLTYSRL